MTNNTQYLPVDLCKLVHEAVPGVETEEWWTYPMFEGEEIGEAFVSRNKSSHLWKSVAPSYRLDDLMRAVEEYGKLNGAKRQCAYCADTKYMQELRGRIYVNRPCVWCKDEKSEKNGEYIHVLNQHKLFLAYFLDNLRLDGERVREVISRIFKK